VRGASQAQAVVVISSRSSQPIEKIAAEAKKTPLWYQVDPEPDMAPILTGVQRAVKAGCRVVCLTVGAPYRPASAGATPNTSGAAVDQVRRAVNVPVVLKGITRAEDAKSSRRQGRSGNHRLQ